MDPLLFEGDIVIIEPVKYNEIEVGDIITYRHPDRCPTRRVVAVHSDRLVLWRDAWPERMFSVTPGDVLGAAMHVSSSR